MCYKPRGAHRPAVVIKTSCLCVGASVSVKSLGFPRTNLTYFNKIFQRPVFNLADQSNCTCF